MPLPKHTSRNKPSLCLSYGCLFLGRAFSALLLLWGFSSISTLNDAVALNCNAATHVAALDFRFHSPDTTFYDDPEIGYTMDNTVCDWDQKRREWLVHHPSFTVEARERVVMVTGSQPSLCKNPIIDYLLPRFFKNKVDYEKWDRRGVVYTFHGLRFQLQIDRMEQPQL